MGRRHMSASQRLSAELGGNQRRLLGPLQARNLEEQAWSLVPKIFQALAGHNRVCLMECACEPDSLLSSAVQAQQKREQAATRCSLFNGCDLSSDAGVRLIMKRIDLEKPQHVWLSPPCGPFSPLQRTNQGTPEQAQDLKQKRQEAIRIYVGTSCVMHYAIQQGIHVTLELADRSDAWRLPALNQLQSKYQLYRAVTKGCAVGLRDKKTGSLMQKGWRILTTHKRLSEAMDLPCRCPKNYCHGKCEGSSASASARYTPEYAKRAARVICQELSHQDVIRECQGQSFLVQGFGEGEFCTCGEVCLPGVPRTCPCCLREKSDFLVENASELDVAGVGALKLPQKGLPERQDSNQDHDDARRDQVEGVQGCSVLDVWEQLESRPPDLEQHEGLTVEDAQGKVEQLAHQMNQAQEYQHAACARLLGQISYPNRSQCRNLVQGHQPKYMILGAYAHGNHYGVTQWTRKYPHLCRYLMNYMRHWSPTELQCSTIMINDNAMTGMHRDVHNAPGTPSYIVGVTKYQQGGIWVEGVNGPEKSTKVWKQLPNGQQQVGWILPTCQKTARFDARKWHEVQPWQGQRQVVGAYTSRGVYKLGSQDKTFLQQLGMKWSQPQEAMVVEGPTAPPRLSQSAREEQIKRQLYLLHAATGHGSTRHMIDALKRRHADPLVLKLAQEFVCPVCQERKKVSPKQVASLEALPPKFHTIAADIGHWLHGPTGEQQNFMVVMDEGSRFRVAKILSKGSKKTPNAASCINFMSEGWIVW